MNSFWCQLAWLEGHAVPGVRISIAAGVITAVERAPASQPGDVTLSGLVFPGFANAHSHAFHRALRGRTQVDRGGSFWTWREQMYEVAARLDPDSYYELAKACFAEMIVSGICAVAEFHYLHHQPSGRPYADPNAMSAAIRSAAAEAGIRLTLLDTCYLSGGLTASGRTPLNDRQARFSDGTVANWAARHQLLEPDANTVIGAAIHSIRAVPPDDIPRVVGAAAGGPLHVHLSEQQAENEASDAVYGKSPALLLSDTGALGPRTVAVHATHLGPADLSLLARSGTGVCMCPTTERDLADGIGLARDLSRAGSPISVGSDSHAVIDLLEEVRGVEMDERLRSGARGRFSPAELVGMLTRNGYAALDRVAGGALEVGGLGDLVAVTTDSIRTAGSSPDELVLTATAADVTDVIVGGERLVSNGRHRSVDVSVALRTAIRAVHPLPSESAP